MQHSNLLQVGLEAVKAAEEVILHYYKVGTSVDLKSDHTPVTQADREAEQKIKEVITNYFPNHGFLGEEYGSENENAEYTWVIDPIDGTKNFVRHMPFFSTQLGLMKGTEFVAGVAHWPVQQNLLYAERSKGAYLNDEPITVSKVDSLEKSYLNFGALPYFEERGLTEKLVSLSQQTCFYRGWGAELGQLYLPTGNIDIHIDPHLKIWDVSPLITILTEAGGKITDLKGQPVTKDVTGIIATNGILHARIVDHFNS